MFRYWHQNFYSLFVFRGKDLDIAHDISILKVDIFQNKEMFFNVLVMIMVSYHYIGHAGKVRW